MDLKGDEKKSSQPLSETDQQQHSSNYAPYPKLDPTDVAPPPPYQENWGAFVGTESKAPQSQSGTSVTKSESPPSKSVNWSPDNPPPPPIPDNTARAMPPESNPYVSASSTGPSTVKNTVNTVKDVLGRWGKKVGETSKKAEELAGNVWQHLNTGPSVADAAMGRIAQGTKVIAEGGYDKIFQRTFNTVEDEQLKKSFACYLSTSAGPVMGVLYLSTAKLAFCSDNPLSYKIEDQTEWSYYKDDLQEIMLTIKQHMRKSNLFKSVVQVVLPLQQLKAVNPSLSKGKPVEKYIQVISVDNHEFWFMAFVNYDSAVKYLQEALQVRNS